MISPHWFEAGNSTGRKIKVIRNSILPFGKDYGAINLFGILFAKRNFNINPATVNHELIHTAQMKELLYIPFYILYFIEWIFLLVRYHGDMFKAYKNISFEREAYDHQNDLNYLDDRLPFSQWRK